LESDNNVTNIEAVDVGKQEIPLTMVPHLMNEQLLAWNKAQFDGLKAIYDKLDEILLELRKR
jgi:hypothetical protein